MFRPNPAIRLSFALVSLVVCVLMAAQSLGIWPDWREERLDSRVAQAQSIAIYTSLMTSHRDVPRLQAALKTLVDRNDDLQYVAVRERDGTVVASAGTARSIEAHASRGAEFRVPIYSGDDEWGEVQLQFQPFAANSVRAWIEDPHVRVMAFAAAASMVLFYFCLRRALKQLNPSRVVPSRVRAALDTITSGVLIVDDKERIVLANKALVETVQASGEQLLGKPVETLPWRRIEGADESDVPPWRSSLAAGEVRIGEVMNMAVDEEDERTFLVNSAPIQGSDHRNRGVLVSLEDVTALERKKAELARMLKLLQESREEVCRQNQVLQRLATVDPLTLCLNRRSFFEKFEAIWTEAKSRKRSLSCIMVDVDHFKQVNDVHGHSTGDEVLRGVAETLRKSARQQDIVCRYGGEEFCVLLPDTDIDGAEALAESLRSAIEATEFPHGHVTASLGVSANTLGAASPQEMLDEADKCLYAAKRTGRNCVVRWDRVPPEAEVEEDEAREKTTGEESDDSLSFQTVNALFSALSYRDPETGEHCRRVADRCVEVARGLLSRSDTSILEVAALLHDMGKINVPDSILRKPTPLDETEEQRLQEHIRVGVDIIRSAFHCDKLTRIVEQQRYWFGGTPGEPDLPQGEAILLESRILAVANTFESMIAGRPYRKALSRQEAFGELRRLAGTRFDPDIVERFIHAHQQSDRARRETTQPVTRHSALQLGLEIERLTDALDRRDLDLLQSVAGQIRARAEGCQLDAIVQSSGQLETMLATDPEIDRVLTETRRLVELCRDAQQSFLKQVKQPPTAQTRAARPCASAVAMAQYPEEFGTVSVVGPPASNVTSSAT